MERHSLREWGQGRRAQPATPAPRAPRRRGRRVQRGSASLGKAKPRSARRAERLCLQSLVSTLACQVARHRRPPAGRTANGSLHKCALRDKERHETAAQTLPPRPPPAEPCNRCARWPALAVDSQPDHTARAWTARLRRVRCLTTAAAAKHPSRCPWTTASSCPPPPPATRF